MKQNIQQIRNKLFPICCVNTLQVIDNQFYIPLFLFPPKYIRRNRAKGTKHETKLMPWRA